MNIREAKGYTYSPAQQRKRVCSSMDIFSVSAGRGATMLWLRR